MPSSRPIEHVVLIVKENHAFDNYFGRFPGANGDASMSAAANPPAMDPHHDHAAWLRRETGAVRQQYSEADIPAYWSYARQYALCDNYFTDVAGPSTPNHLMLIAAQSPIIDNPPSYRLPAGQALYDMPSLPAILEEAGLTWGNYGGYAFDFIKALHGRNKLPSTQFLSDAATGKLPTVSWVYADHELSEHPPDTPADRAAGVGNVTKGMQWTVDQVNAVLGGKLWPIVAMFITWDDWGGWADHVAPPLVQKWTDGTQFRYGSRVGCLAVSPYARQGYVSKIFHSHVSLVKFCETTFGLPPTSSLSKAADDMSDCFDYTQAPLPPPR